MKKKLISHSLIALFVISLFYSCDNEETFKGEYAKGVIITNEGSFGNNNASLSFYNYDSDSVYNNIFEAVNDRNLGDVIQSVSAYNNEAFIVVNNSNKIEIADKNTMEELGVISLNQPRYVVFSNGFGYATSWTLNAVVKFDAKSYTLLDTIAVGIGPDKMAVSNNKLFVVNTGGWSSDSTVSVINLENDEAIETLVVKDNPKDIEVDKDGNVWVLCAGKEIYNDDWTAVIAHTPSYLVKIDADINHVSLTVELFAEQHPGHFEFNKNGSIIYLGGGFTFSGIYQLQVDGFVLSQFTEDFAYGLNFDKESEKLFVFISSFTSAGSLKRYDTDGTLLGTYTCGIGPSGTQMKQRRILR